MKFLYPSAVIRRRASEKGTHSEAFQSWRWVLLAAILLAVVTIGTFYFSSAQAQEANGAITGLTLTSDTPGTLTVSWDTASPAPTDYRVDWAKSTEEYQSWTVDKGHVYPAETATTVTITDLDHDIEYKIRLRARYYKGEHEDEPWGGPWAEESLEVAGEPEETPTPEPAQEEESTPEPGTIDTLTATDDAAGRLVLAWGPPAAPHAEPTDYHVNWARSAEDYPSDTEEDGNAHPTTTTHTLDNLEYGTEYKVRVRARYTDADSPWSGPWTDETVRRVRGPAPAAPQGLTATAVEEVEGERTVVRLGWTAPAHEALTGYRIWRGPDADSLTVLVGDTNDTAATYDDTSVSVGESYHYAVAALSLDGMSPRSGSAEVPLPAVAQSQQDDGAISGLTLTSDSPGVLDVSWDTPGTTPADYWVSWARSGEDWPSETDDTANRYPTTTSLQLTGLDEGTEYQVRVRARYTDGGDADSPWSGPWAEASLQVAGNPQLTPTPETDGSRVSDFAKGEYVASHSFGSAAARGRAIWSDGETIWITRLGDWETRLGGRADAYGLSDMARQPEKDITAMFGVLNHHANGIWSDGQTMWISDDERARIFAYSLQSDNYGNRLKTKEFQTFTENYRNLYASPKGLWSDGTHMWVADAGVRKIHAYTLGGQRNADLDLNLLDGVGNDSPTDIWSNGYTMWVADDRDKKVYAYRLSDGVRQPGLDYNNLESAGNVSPKGIWSNGKLMYVFDNSNNTLYSYRSLAPFPGLSSLSLVSGTDAVDIGAFNAFDLEYSARVARSVSQVRVNYSAASGVGVEVSPPDADPNAPGRQVDLALTTGNYEEATEITVNATQDGATATYRVRVTRVDVDAISSDATLSSLSLVDVNFGTFDSANLSYEAVVASSLAQTTVSLTTADPGARYLISPSDADDAATGYQVDLAVGLNGITIEVTASDAEKTTRRYFVEVVRPSESEFGWLVVPDFKDLSPSKGFVRAIWSDGETMWVTFSGDGLRAGDGTRAHDRIRAYDFDTKAHLGHRDIVDNWIRYANGIWSDGNVVAVSENQSPRIHVYDLNSGGWRPWLGFRLDSSNHNSKGLWSDGVTLWVVDHGNDKLYAYHWRGENHGDRRPEFDFKLTDGNGRGAGLWSDGTTMWVSDDEDGKIYAYSLDSATYGLRVPALDFNGLAPHGNSSPNGIWSNGSVMWVADDEGNRLYAYKMPALPSLASLSLSGIEFGPFKSWQSKYAVRVPVGGPSVTTVSAVANNADQFDVKIAPSDSDALTDGHQVALATGTPQTIAVTVTKKTDPCVSRTYTLRVELAVSGPAAQ